MLHADVHGVAIMNIHNQMQTNTYTVKKYNNHVINTAFV